MKNCWGVYLALFILLILILFSNKEGLDEPTYSGDKWLNFSSWFTTTPKTTTRENTTIMSTTSNTDNNGSGLYGNKYETSNDTSNDLTSTEKSYAKSALTKLIALNEGNEVLISCINKVKVNL